MRYFELRDLIEDREINSLLLDVNIFAGKEQVLQDKNINLPFAMRQLFSEVESTNTIEGVFVDSAKEVFKQKDGFKNETELEWIGVKIAFEHLKENFNSLALSSNNLKKIHAILMNGSKEDIAGKFKTEEIWINQYQNKKFIQAIETSSPEKTPQDIEEAIERYYNNLSNYPQYKIISTILFIGEFLAIHPFADGNGRMSRLMIVWLLARLGIKVAQSISLTKYIQESKKEYYAVLDIASEGMSKSDYHKDFIKPWVLYYLKLIKKAYDELNQVWEKKSTDKEEQIFQIISNYSDTFFSRKDIIEHLPHIDPSYISKILDKQVKLGKLNKFGKLKGTKYKKS